MFKKRFSRALAVTTTASLIMAAAAFAQDALWADGDGVLPVSNSSLDLGSVCPEGSIEPSANNVLLALRAINRNSQSWFGDAVSVNLSGSTGGDLTLTSGSILTPSDWTTGATPRTSSAAAVKVTLDNAGAIEGANSAVVTWTASGPGFTRSGAPPSTNPNPNVLITSNMTVNWTVLEDTDPTCISAPINSAPSTPGTPTTISPNQGAFTLDWTASTDDGLPIPPGAIVYALRGMDADDADWGSIASDIGTNSYTFSAGEPAEGTWMYQVQASDSALTSDWSASSTGVVVDRTDPTFSACSGGPFLRNSGSQAVSITASDPALPDGSSGSGVDAASSTLSGSVDTTTLGAKTVSFTAVDNATNSDSTTCTYYVVVGLSGFERPVDNGIINAAKAGQAIPLKFYAYDALGPVTDLTATDVKVSVASLACARGTTIDEVEEYAAGSSGLQNHGGGYYQFNWKTPSTYANSCKTMTLAVGGTGGSTLTATFEFRK